MEHPGDNLDLVTPEGLLGSFELFADCIQLLERNARLRITPQLGKRGLYPNLSTKHSGEPVRDMMNRTRTAPMICWTSAISLVCRFGNSI